MSDKVHFTAIVWFPSPFVTSLVTWALRKSYPDVPIISTLPQPAPLPLLQFADYDAISHDLTLMHPADVLSSSYVIRKALIRKHFLHRAVTHYLAKNPVSVLASAIPKTWAIEVRFADELDELWADELWELGAELAEQESSNAEEHKWWILKPGMADKGQGIRMFETRDALRAIFEEFEETSDDEEDGSGNGDEDGFEDTRVSAQQMRHFVIQEYVSRPLLVDPVSAGPRPFIGHKFHIRAYVLSQGALTLYLLPRLLLLFSGTPFSMPSSSDSDNSIDLSPHLTNTCLQHPTLRETHVLEIDEIVGKEWERGKLRAEDVEQIRSDVGEVLSDAWRAAVGSGAVHFQPLPNAFEIFGADLLVSTPLPNSDTASNKTFQVHLLEINACPDFEQTGDRLNGVLEDLMTGVTEIGVGGWVSGRQAGKSGAVAEWSNADKKGLLVKILDLPVRAW